MKYIVTKESMFQAGKEAGITSLESIQTFEESNYVFYFNVPMTLGKGFLFKKQEIDPTKQVKAEMKFEKSEQKAWVEVSITDAEDGTQVFCIIMNTNHFSSWKNAVTTIQTALEARNGFSYNPSFD